jgi:hypothetical protein
MPDSYESTLQSSCHMPIAARSCRSVTAKNTTKILHPFLELLQSLSQRGAIPMPLYFEKEEISTEATTGRENCQIKKGPP